ncbi:MAG: molybdopterin-dependent oxidoreductase [Deltaproteobacteria bacterium]|nr:molybdopterin-dependent oxidoreductase [Deltaproteobacteria bacterium]MBI3388496.1 molybdopterin-dependent oxidoreductase [Deltaproteobacteria bacterium]
MSTIAAPALTHSSHWGGFTVTVRDGDIAAVHPLHDPDPSPLLRNLPGSVRHSVRIQQPVARRGWLDHGPGPSRERGNDSFVTLSWNEAWDRAAAEFQRVIAAHGNEAIFGGSYGWGSAGIFHQSQRQLHRFLNCLGGFTSSHNSYSIGASLVLLPHVVGNAGSVFRKATSWTVVAQHTELLVAFGGIPMKNTFVAPGGMARHGIRGHLADARRRGMQIALFSPLRDDVVAEADAHWYPLIPLSDVAVMLALAHVLISEGLYDQAFLDRCCHGSDRFIEYVLGRSDGVAKSPEWAESRSGIASDELRALARRMAASRTLITVSYSLQRAEHGEQPVWAAIALAALLGQIGLPGGGFGHGYGSMGDLGSSSAAVNVPLLPVGPNQVKSFIPVARIADLLLQPGESFDYNGARYSYPDIRLVHWAGGNPFHHHQDLNRLRRALTRPDTIIVHEPYWTAMARHADLIFPATTTFERNDIGSGRADARIIAMQRVVAPVGGALSDHDILAGIAERLGVADAFTEGRDERAWLDHLYSHLRSILIAAGIEAPSFNEFWSAGSIEIPDLEADRVLFDAFRADPEANRLRTPSGKIEVFSERIAGFGYDDCPGHPTWLESDEWLGSPRAARFPLALVANNPATRLHGQLDIGPYSQSAKVQGREPVRIHPSDAAARNVVDGDVVRLFNERGSCLAGAVVSADVRAGVVRLSTGAWFDPDDASAEIAMCVHGNPNVLTRDIGTSRLSQGCSGQHALVELERFTGVVPPVRAFEPPPIES